MSDSSRRARNPLGKTSSGRDSVQKTSSVTACQTCRLKKVKCSGTVPCQYCSKRGLSCVVPPHGPRRVYSVTRIEELESRLARYEDQGNTDSLNENEETEPIVAQEPPQELPQEHSALTVHSTPEDSAPNPRVSAPAIPVPPFPHFAGNEAAAPNYSAGDQPGEDETQRDGYGALSHPSAHSVSVGLDTCRAHSSQGIPAEPSLSSSHAFESKVQDLLIRSGTARSGTTRSDGTHITTSSPGNNIGLSRFTVTTPTDRLPELPPEDEAYRLLETVGFYIGQTQNHFDQRELSDRISLLYANMNDPLQTRDLWYLEIIIIIAIGKLFTTKVDDDGTKLPGTGLFKFAHQNFPSISVHYTHGRLGVEIHALMAMYLQMVDRKEEAYLYISTALRLAILHGYHQNATGAKLLRSERVKLNRLWWTIYMQERRLAAATGKPSGINDEMIDLPLPLDSGGFPPSAPLRANVKIARVTGQVITVLYGPPHRTEDDFVHNVQQIIRDLFEISTEIPSEQFLTCTGINSDLALRTTASLHLMIYQATLLTIRPLMLHVAQLILSGSRINDDELRTEALGKLSRTCSEAARRLLKAVMALKQRNLLATFGFFDCDATFSSAFIMLLTMIFDSACEPDQRINPSPGLRDAMEIMQHLANQGNTYAMQRFREVQSVWNHLSTILEVPESSITTPGAQEGSESSRHGQVNHNQDDSVGHNHLHSTSAGGQLRGGHDVGAVQTDAMPVADYQNAHWDTDMWNSISDIWLPPAEVASGENGHVGSFLADPPIEDYYNHYQSLLNNPDWSLTGQDVGDFAELRKHVLRFN
ncbi:hypothetical protein EDB81DRAFT_784957 [Dactylonectria macrodidyma]|uniref:Zn(2)-C6 fungal-type domain-containing protein n=1 Tax=Dactylonectria macrodidyma TaxID=307937 RepID=A0A9P9FGC9_9HYPO|nr:hypothetical protein EDB81DRAFT_784957 [Dactylonectria macrodidyma]